MAELTSEMHTEVKYFKKSPSFSYLPVIMSSVEFSLRAAYVAQDILILAIKIVSILVKDIIRNILPKSKKDLSGETVLITGSAHGLGRQLALDTSKHGAKVVLWDINECHPNEIKSTKPISHELLEEILLQLAIKNQERIESCKYTEYIWSSDTTEFVFNICEKLTLKKNVKYVALEIYERFVAEHIVDVHKRHSEISKTRKDSRWETVEERIKEQSVLRIMTSVQLASKLESHYENVLPAQVSEVLERIGKPYSLNGIFSSELRILKMLNYKVNLTTPALYVGLLLYILYTNDPSIEESLYDLTTTILDFVYLHRAQLYNELYDALGGDGNDKEKDFNQNFLKVKADYMLLATSVIAATAYLFMNKCYELILEQLHQITRKVKTDIKSFSVVIAYVVMNDIAESLRCSPSLRIHVQLFIALVLQGTSMSMATTPLFLPQYTQPAWLCLFLVVLQMYSGLSSTNWMFIEGLHLHSRLTSRVFQKEAPLAAYHILGWGIPFICTGIWFSLMSRLNVTTTSNECWSGYGRSLIIWIITGPMMAALTVNSLFLIDIIRILISKRMSSNRTTSETEQLRKAVKATALLFPLLGIPHLLFCINPGGDGAWEEAYMFANATLKSSQGFFVSILYCFMNAEVQITLKKAYMRCLSRRNCTRSGTSRQTSTTYVTSQSDTKKSVTTAL